MAHKLLGVTLLSLISCSLLIISCSPEDGLFEEQEQSVANTNEFSTLKRGDIRLLELKSTFTNRREQIIQGLKKGVDYKNLNWSNARFKRFENRELILVAFKPEEGEQIRKVLYFSKDLKGNKLMFVFEMSNELSVNVFSLSHRLLATKLKGERFKSAVSTMYQKSSTEDEWYEGGTFDEIWITGSSGYQEPDPWFTEPFVPSCSGCGNEPYVPTEPNPYEGYPDCYFYTYGCGGPPTNDTGSGDGGNVEVNNDEVDVLLSPDRPIIDISTYLKDFNLSKGAVLTIYVDQPINGQSNAFKPLGDVKAGHSFISITQDGITRVFGFYPIGLATPLNPIDPFQFGNDESSIFDVSITFSVSPEKFKDVINNISTYDRNYDLNNNNCVDFVINTARWAGFSLPDPQGEWTGGGGSNPGAFCESLRVAKLPEGVSRNNDGGRSPANSN